MKLDLKDKKILFQLDLNARQTNSQIAKKVGLSKEVVNYRIKQLEKKEIIKGYYTIIDSSKLGYFSFRVYIKLMDVTSKIEEEILDYLVKGNKTIYVAKIDGLFDIAFGIWVKDVYEFEKFYLEFKKKFKQYMGRESIAIFSLVYHFHRSYLLNKLEEKTEYFGRSEIIKYDKKDIEILKLIAGNARINVIEISSKLKIPERTVAFRIKNLEKKGIIQGYRPLLNLKLLDYEYYKVDLTLKNILRLQVLINFCKLNPNITYIDLTIAGSDFEFDIEIENKKEFLKLIEELKNKFPEIREWNYFTLQEYKKLIYFPNS